MAGVRRHQGRAHGLEVADLAHQDDVGVLAQDVLEPVVERAGVEADLALMDDRHPVEMEELDRVLDRDHVARGGAVDGVDHRRQRGGLARAGAAGDQDEAARREREIPHHRGQLQLLDGRHLDRDVPQGDRGSAALHENVGAEPPQPRDSEGEVDLAVGREVEPLLVAQELVADGAQLLRVRRGVLERRQDAVHAHDRRRADLEVEVAGPGGDHLLEHAADVHRSPRTDGRASTAVTPAAPGTASGRTPRAGRSRPGSGRCAPACPPRSRS